MSRNLHPPFKAPGVRRQRGVTLIEALVALLVMSFGMLALVGLMSNLRRGADLAKQRSEAMRLARADLALMRGYSGLDRQPGDPATNQYYSDIASGTQPSLMPTDSNTSYTLQRFVSNVQGAPAKQVRVLVTWKDRADEDQAVTLDTIIARVDPVFSAVVGLNARNGAVIQPSGRHPAIPDAAKKLDKDISAFRPSSLGSTIWVFNNFTGVITGICSIPAGTPVSALTTADVDACKNNTIGYLLAGTVHFSNVNPPNPKTPEANAIPLDVDIVDGTYQLPKLDVHGDLVRDSQGNITLDTYAAKAPNHDCFDQAPGSANATPAQQFVDYYCIVYPDPAPAGSTVRTWSGKAVLTGFTTGLTAAEYRVCRYSADYNGSDAGLPAGLRAISLLPSLKALDNSEHPPVYGAVTGSLARQNFLVIRGDLSCPTAPAVDPDHGVYADYSTLQSQP